MARNYVINGEALVRVKFGEHIYNTVGNVHPMVSGIRPVTTRDLYELTSGSPAVSGNVKITAPSRQVYELGLAVEDVRIAPQFYHSEIHSDEWGREAAADVLVSMGEVSITMTLIHYDRQVLTTCVSQALGGSFDRNPEAVGPVLAPVQGVGVLQPAGALLGNGLRLGNSGNYFVSLNVLSPQEKMPWRFPASYLSIKPMEAPLGTRATGCLLMWKAIPYNGIEKVQTGTKMVKGQQLPVFSFKEQNSSGAVLWDHGLDV